MDKISNLFCKVGGLLIFILNIPNINYYIGIFMQYKEKSLYSFAAIVIAPNIFQLVLSLLMFFKPEKISNRIVSNEDRTERILDDSHVAKIEQICISILGLYMACSCLSGLVFNISSYIKAVIDSNYIDVSSANSSSFIITIIATLIELFISLLLITQNKKIHLIISKIRNQPDNN